MPKKALMIAVTLLSVACTKQHRQGAQEVSRFTPGGSLKPTIAIVPVIDNSHSGLTWSVSQEFTSGICDQIARKNRLFVENPEKLASVTRELKESNNPFSNDYSWVKKNFQDSQFVVFLELIEHNEELLNVSNTTGPAELHMAMRVRIFDVRQERPKVVLQEIVQKDHYIPKFFTRNLTFQPDWNQEGYTISPMGIAHSELSTQVAKRIDHYVGLHSKS